jgi:hypothetical protein
MNSSVNHGLRFARLKERRRELIVSPRRTQGPINGRQPMYIAPLQRIITACAEVLVGHDAEMEAGVLMAQNNVVCLRNP